MKTIRHLSKANNQRGSILVICMVLAGIGTIGAAAFFSLIQAKSMETLERETAMNRRIRLANSRALAKEALLRDHLAANAAPGTVTYTLPGGWGEANISQHTQAPLAVTTTTRSNKTGFIQPAAFTEDIEVTLSDGNSNLSYQAQAKTYHPALGGDLLVVHRPQVVDSVATQFTGTFNVKGRAVFHNASYSATSSPIRTDRILKIAPTLPPTSMLNTSGAAILPDNGALPRTTEGLTSTTGVAGTFADYSGGYKINFSTENTVNDYAEMVAAKAGISLSGTTIYVTTEASATVVPNANDGGAMDLINAANSPFDSGLPTALRAIRPLSSAVMSSLLAKATIVDTIHVKTVLMDNSPLPQDVLTAMMTSTAIDTADKWAIVYDNPVGVAYDGNGSLYVDLDSLAVRHLSINSTGSFQAITLRGQADAATSAVAANLSPLIISLHGAAVAGDFATVNLDGQNNRPLVFAASQNGAHTITRLDFRNTAGAFPRWRGIFDVHGMTMDVRASAVSAATIVGGIRTDRSINITDGALTLERETTGSVLTALQGATTRTAWLEFYNLP